MSSKSQLLLKVPPYLNVTASWNKMDVGGARRAAPLDAIVRQHNTQNYFKWKHCKKT